MKTTIRAFVVALVLVGAGSTTFVSASPNSSNGITVKAHNVVGLPAPLCAPSDPTHCGMD
jgi:hypothetical protein